VMVSQRFLRLLDTLFVFGSLCRGTYVYVLAGIRTSYGGFVKCRVWLSRTGWLLSAGHGLSDVLD